MVICSASGKRTSWRPIDVKASLLAFDRTGLLGLIQDLYAVSKNNEAFLHARLGLGRKQLEPYKTRISKSICPDMMRSRLPAE
jgi:hypothetical protein